MVKYNIALRIVHWIMALSILGLICVGWYMEGLTPEEGKYAFYPWHKIIGLFVLVLFLVRIALRKMTAIPALPVGIKSIEKKASHAVHMALYVLMFAVPAIGYVFSTSGGHAITVPILGWGVPDIIGEHKVIYDVAKEAHWISAYCLLAIVGLHVAGALKHRFFEPKENDVLGRMM